MMRIAPRLFILCCLLAGLAHPSSSYAKGDESEALVNTVKSVIAAEKEQATPDTVFKFNTGIETLKSGANKALGEDSAAGKYLRKKKSKLGNTIPEKTLDGVVESFYSSDTDVKNYKKSVKSKKKVLDKIKRKHTANQALSDALGTDQDRHAKNLRSLSEQKVNATEFEQKYIKKQIKQEAKKLNRATTAQKRVNRRIAQNGLTKTTKQLTEFEKKLLDAKNSVSIIKRAKARKMSFDKKNLLVGVVLTAISSELEENAMAAKEGRPPRASNKVWNFAKNISGYSTVMGVMESAEMAKLEAFVEVAEFYKKNGFDLNDPDIQAKIEATTRRAVQKRYLYEGAKLAPVVGDLVNIKEAADAGTDAVVAIEELSYIRASNKQAQFQMGLKTAIKADAKVTEMEKIVEQTNQLVASLGKLKGQLLNMEKAAAVNRDKISQAVQTLEAYNEQAQALQNPAVASSLDESNTDALLSRLNAIKASADEQIGNITRVKSEHASGELTPQGVANQTRFIGDLLQPTVDDYANLQPTLSGIEAIGKGAELAAQVPQALELLRQGKGVMQKEAQRTEGLYATYREQAGNLKDLFDRFKTLKKELKKHQDFLDTSSNLEQVHRERIRSTVARSRDISINKNAITKAIEDARGLRNSAELVSALAVLDKAPPVVDTSQVNALVGRAQQAWGKLSGSNLATAESLQKAQGLLNELVALAGDMKPVDLDQKVEEKVSSSGLFNMTKWLNATNADYQKIVSNNEKGDFINDTHLGFRSFSLKRDGLSRRECNTSKKLFCPNSDRTLYKIVHQGTTERGYSGQWHQVPYWVVFEMRNPHLSVDYEYFMDKNISANAKTLLDYHSEKNKDAEVYSVNVKGSQEAVIVKKDHMINLHTKSGPYTSNLSGYLYCIAGALEKQPRVTFNGRHAWDEGPALHLAENFLSKCQDGQETKREVILIETAETLASEIKTFSGKVKSQFYFSPIPFNLSFTGLTPGPQNKNRSKLVRSSGVAMDFERRWREAVGAYVDEFYEVYGISVSRDFADFQKSWEDVTNELDEKIAKQKTRKYITTSKAPKIKGAENAWFTQKYEEYTDQKIPDYRYEEHIRFRIANILVAVSGRVKSNEQKTRTLEVANAVASKILSAERGW